jgi:O-antigen/teichoic acid export membrane protein
MSNLANKISNVFMADVVAFSLSIVTGIILARGLGAVRRGEYEVCFSAVHVMAAILTGGLHVGNTYFAASGKLKPSKLAGISLLWIGITAAFVLIFFPVFVLTVGGKVLKGIPNDLFVLIGIMAPTLIADNLASAIILGLRNYLMRNVIQIFRQLLRAGFVALAIFAFAGFTREAMIASIIASAITALIGFWFVISKTGVAFDLRWDKIKPIFRYCMNIYPAAVAGLIFGYVNVFFINNYDIPRNELGAYGVASSGILPLIFFLPSAISSVIFPELSFLSRERQNAIAPLISRCTLLVSIPLVVISAIVAKPVVRIAFGSEYVLTPCFLYWLLPGVLFSIISKVCSQMLNASAHSHYTSIISVSTVLTIVLFNLLLVPAMGTRGASLAFSLAYGFNAGLCLFLCRAAKISKISDMILFRASDLKLILQSGKKVFPKFGILRGA